MYKIKVGIRLVKVIIRPREHVDSERLWNHLEEISQDITPCKLSLNKERLVAYVLKERSRRTSSRLEMPC